MSDKITIIPCSGMGKVYGPTNALTVFTKKTAKTSDIKRTRMIGFSRRIELIKK